MTKTFIVKYNPYTREANYFTATHDGEMPYTDSQDRLNYKNVVMSETADSIVEIFAASRYASVDRLRIEYYGSSDDFEAFKVAVEKHEKAAEISVIDKCNLLCPDKVKQELEQIFDALNKELTDQKYTSLFDKIKEEYADENVKFSDILKKATTPDNTKAAYQSLSSIVDLLIKEITRQEEENKKDADKKKLKECRDDFLGEIDNAFVYAIDNLWEDLPCFDKVAYKNKLQQEIKGITPSESGSKKLHKKCIDYSNVVRNDLSDRLNTELKERTHTLLKSIKERIKASPFEKVWSQIVENIRKPLPVHQVLETLPRMENEYSSLGSNQPYIKHGLFVVTYTDNTKAYIDYLSQTVDDDYISLREKNIKRTRSRLHSNRMCIKNALSAERNLKGSEEYMAIDRAGRSKKQELESVRIILSNASSKLDKLYRHINAKS